MFAVPLPYNALRANKLCQFIPTFPLHPLEANRDSRATCAPKDMRQTIPGKIFLLPLPLPMRAVGTQTPKTCGDTMSSEPQNPGSDESGEDWSDDEQFKQWIQDPANHNSFIQTLNRALLGEFGDLTPELAAPMRAAVAAQQEKPRLNRMMQKYEALKQHLAREDNEITPEDWIKQSRFLIDEVTDAALEISEPRRTAILTDLLPLREKIRALRLEEE